MEEHHAGDIDRNKLLDYIRKNYSDSELRDLCFGIGIDYESLEGGNKSAKARELVGHCERHGLMDQLTAALRQDRAAQFAKAFPAETGATTPATDEERNRLIAQAQDLLKQRRFDEAAGLLREAYRSDPGSQRIKKAYADTLYECGVHWYLDQKLPKAKIAFQEVVAIDFSHDEAANYLRDIERRLAAPAYTERPAAPAPRRPSPNFIIAVTLGIVAVLACAAAWLVVPEFRQWLGLDKLTPTSIAVSPAHTATISPRPTATPTSTSTPTKTPTPTSTTTPTKTPTPPEAPIRALIESEAQAALTRDMNLTRSIFAPDAVRIDAATGQTRNAYEAYADLFRALGFIDAAHARIDIAVTGDTASAVSDSCGSFMDNRTGAKVDFGGPQSDRWAFKQDANGKWQISSLTINVPSTERQQRYTFEDNSHDCWLVRIDNSVPQGLAAAPTHENAHEGQTALRFDYDTSLTTEHRGQVAHIRMPFAGRASAWIYAPPDAPVDLEAGFFAMELDHEPWKYHAANQTFRLAPGQWTQITWDTDVTGWAQPPQLLGIEVRQPGGGGQPGHVLIDDVTITSR